MAPEPDAFNLQGRLIFLDSAMVMSGVLQGRNTVNGDLVDFNLTGFGIAHARVTLDTNQFDELRFGKGQLGRLIYDVQPIPEPSTWLLLGSRLIWLALLGRRRRSKVGGCGSRLRVSTLLTLH